MALTITYTGAGEGQQATTLGDDAAGDVIRFQERDHTRLVEEVPMFMAAAQKTIGARNARNVVGFIVERVHASVDAAITHFLQHPDSLPDQGTLSISAGGASINLADATLRQCSIPNPDGKSTVTHYLFTGGLFS